MRDAVSGERTCDWDARVVVWSRLLLDVQVFCAAIPTQPSCEWPSGHSRSATIWIEDHVSTGKRTSSFLLLLRQGVLSNGLIVRTGSGAKDCFWLGSTQGQQIPGPRMEHGDAGDAGVRREKAGEIERSRMRPLS